MSPERRKEEQAESGRDLPHRITFPEGRGRSDLAELTNIEIEPEQSSAHAQSYPPETIPALAALLDALRERGVRYCLWKSNLRLPHALTGRTDLDLLIDRKDAGAFRAVLTHHPVKPMVPSPHATYPGMHHLLGFDSATGQLFHLHVHYQMVLGEQYVKNHRFPMEQDFLGSIRVLHGVPVPSAAMELAILAVRALLKYRARDVVKDVLHIRTPGLATDIRNEVLWLLRQTSVEDVRFELNAAGAPLPVESICDFLEVAQGAPRSGYRLLRLRGRLRRTVQGMQRGGRLRARATYLRAALRNRRRFRTATSDHYAMSPAGGGFGVALIGVDGSGKSTHAQALVDWLSWKLESRVVYMGSKQPSTITRWLYLAFRAQRRARRSFDRRRWVPAPILRSLDVSRDLTLALHHLSVGRDRMRRYESALRDIRRGAIAIFDRFPLHAVDRSAAARLLDGPQIASTLVEGRGRLTDLLARTEERMYERFCLPEYVFVLQVNPAVSAARKPDHPFEILFEKNRAVRALPSLLSQHRGATDLVQIDAHQPLNDVLLNLKARLWDAL